jgi:hypothetical protein
MKKIKELFRSIKSKLSVRIIWFFVLFNLTAFTVWKVYSFFSFENTTEQTTVTSISKDNSIKELAATLKLKSDDNLFTVGLPPINNALYVNTKNKTLLFQTQASEKQVVIEYESTNGLIKKVKSVSQETFDDFVKNNFQIPNYPQLESEGVNIEKSEIISVGKLIGADSTYLEQVAATTGNDIRTILLSLIYNTVFSGRGGQIATVIENKKLESLTYKNYNIDKVNTVFLAESLNKLNSDGGTGKTKFIEIEYNKLHPSNESSDTSESKNTLQVGIQNLLRTKAIQLDASFPFDVVYVNYRKDILYCGERGYQYSSKTFSAINDSELDYLFAKQLAVANYNSLSAKNILMQVGIPADSVTLDETGNSAQIAFKALLLYILNHPSVYCISNGKLVSSLRIENDSIQYGKFDVNLLKSGIENLSHDNFESPEYSIVKKESFTPRIIYATLFLLFLSYCIMFYKYPQTQPVNVQEEFIPTGDITEQLNKQREKYETLIQKSIYETRENTIFQITKFLSKPGGDFDYKNDTLILYCRKINFYNELEKCSNSTELVKKIENERTRNQNIPKIESANDVFAEANKQNSRTEKITYLLEKFDEYSNYVSKEKEKLIEKFQDYKKAKKSNDNLNTLLKEECRGDFYNYLKEQIARIESNPSIEAFVRFGLLFKNSTQSQSKSESEILKQYNETNGFIDDFYQKYQKIGEAKFLDRTAIICWSLELTNNLLKIRSKKVNFDTEKFKQDQLQLIPTKYFIEDAKNKDKTLDDFELSIMRGNERIAEYNSKIADSISSLKTDTEYSEYINVLKDLMRKIKKYESSELVFKKLYEHFVSDFLYKVENLKFNEREVLPEDRSWLFQQLFNIAFHTADYVEYFVKEDDIKYHSNFLFLKNDFDLAKTEHRPFVENDMEQSTRVSNTVVKAARFAGVKQLDLLINKYYIKPEQLS